MQRQSATTLLALLVGCAVIPATHAYSVNVVSSQPVTRQIMPELATIQGIMEEMVAVAGAVPEMTGARARRAAAALGRIRHEPEPVDIEAARAVVADALASGA